MDAFRSTTYTSLQALGKGACSKTSAGRRTCLSGEDRIDDTRHPSKKDLETECIFGALVPRQVPPSSFVRIRFYSIGELIETKSAKRFPPVPHAATLEFLPA
jgi:hypothetical protein